MKVLPLGLISAGLLFAQTEERAIIPQIADGGGWKTRVVIVNRSLSLAARPILNFFGQNGAPLAFSILGAGMVSNLERTIPPGGSLIVETAGLQPEVQAGWVQLRSGSPAVPGDYMTPGLPATSPVLAFVSFRHRVPERPDFEASVMSFPAETQSAAFALDNMENYVTSVAVANTLPSETDVAVTFRDASGNVFHRDLVTLAGRGHAFFETINRFQAARNRRGTVEFSTQNGRLAALCLWFNPTGAFTSVPSLSLQQ